MAKRLIVFLELICLTRGYDIIGIYSKCENRPQITSKLHREAILYDRIVNYTFQYAKRNYKEFTDVNYISYDVCNDRNEVLNLTQRFFLDPSFFMEKNIMTGKQYTILFFLSFLETELQKLLFEQLIGIRFYVMTFDQDTVIPPYSEKISSKNVRDPVYFKLVDPMAMEVNVIAKHARILGWNRIGILLLRNNNTNGEYFLQMYQMLESKIRNEYPELCYFKDEINIEDTVDFTRAVDILHGELIPNVLILLGDSTDQVKFIKEVGRDFHNQHTWFTHDLEDLDYHFPNEYINIFSFISALGRDIVRRRTEFQNLKSQFENYFVRGGHAAKLAYSLMQNTFKSISVRMEIALRRNRFFRNLLKNGVRSSLYSSLYAMFRSLGSYHRVNVHSIQENGFLLSSYPEELIERSSCQIHVCQPGWEQTTGQLLDHHTKWKYEYGHTCQKCKLHHVKPTYGDLSCTKCPEFFQMI